MAFPIIGRPADSGRLPKVLCAPLLLYPATLEPSGLPSGGFSLRLEADEGRLNAPAITAFLGGDEPAGGQLEALLEQVPATPFGWGRALRPRATARADCPGLDAQALHGFPRLMSRDEVEREVRSARRAARPWAQLPTGLCPGPGPQLGGDRGILSGLERLSTAESHSRPLTILLGDDSPPTLGTGRDEPPAKEATAKEATADMGRAPAVLSHAQERALSSANRHPLTLVNGPPGTGKSYTLAAIALEHVSRGESVLIAGRREQPLTVIEKKIEELLQAPSFVMRAGRRSQMRQLKDHLQALLHGADPLRGAQAGVTTGLARELGRIERRLEELEHKLETRGGLEQRLGEREAETEPGLGWLFRSVSKRWVRWQLDRLGDHWRLLDDYERTLDYRTSLTAELLRAEIRDRIRKTLQWHHRQLKSFLSALKARQSQRQDQLFRQVHPNVLLHAFPLWMVTFADAHLALPGGSELFDLVLIDEATQCDLASCLPIIDRGKRLVVTGDPKQLRHVSFLSRSRQRHLATRHELPEHAREAFDYRYKSLLDRTSDALTTVDQATVLDEHFRSSPQIIAFSNREFYDGGLRIMTRRPETSGRRTVELRPTDGQRDDQGVNAVEARALLDELASWVERERDLPSELCHSLGVLSPFRDQVEHLEREIRERLDLGAIDKHEVLVGTPFAFQGEERDVMFLSFAVDAMAHAGSFIFLNRSDVFNVAITRARDHQFVFCSLEPAEARSPLLRRYLEEIASPGEPSRPAATSAAGRQDPFLLEVQQALEDRGFRTWPAYDVAGFTIDLIAGKVASGVEGRTFGIDLIGHPGPYAEAFDLERCRMLERAGLDVFPLPRSAWQTDPTACLEAIETFHRSVAPEAGPSAP